jgi:hypothetical protein
MPLHKHFTRDLRDQICPTGNRKLHRGSSEKLELTYAPRAPWHKRHHAPRVATIVSFVALFVVLALWIPRWIRCARLLQLEQDCLSFRAGDQTIAAAEGSDGATAIPLGQSPASPAPECWSRFYSVLSGTTLRSDGTAFLHQRFTPSGQCRLVAVDAVFVHAPNQGSTGISLHARAFDQPQWFQIPRELSSNYYGGIDGPGFVQWYRSARLLTGKPDAADSSHFTIELELDGRRRIIDGFVRDENDDVMLKERADPLTP